MVVVVVYVWVVFLLFVALAYDGLLTVSAGTLDGSLGASGMFEPNPSAEDSSVSVSMLFKCTG